VTLSIPDFSKTSVVVAGDVMLDQYLFGATSRISPEAPVPVVHVQQTDDRPGGAANVAVNLASLGVKTRLIGAVGDDAAARTLEHLLVAQGIDCDFAHVTDRPTITKTRVQSRGQQLIRLDQESAAELRDSALVDAVGEAAAGAGAVVLSDYGKGALTDVREMIELCRSAGTPVLVDPKGRDFEKYRGATLLTPNQGEFEAVAGHCGSDAELAARGWQMVEELELTALLVTRSERGMMRSPSHRHPRWRTSRQVSSCARSVSPR
jgi:D-beta-D-heptose 7-phosphate kinase/D-beta-D-heptose 1-phosphate adenosyltransferase